MNPPTNAVWEITNACNMKCIHCYSEGSNDRNASELTTDQALALCDSLAELGLTNITLSGGELFLRKDWHLIAERLVQKGIQTNVISNGWFINAGLIQQAEKAGIKSICISLDGLKRTHDYIRAKGSFKRVLAALKTMNDYNMPVMIRTTVNTLNLKELPRLKKILYDYNVNRWQFRLLLPIKNSAANPSENSAIKHKNHQKLVISAGDTVKLIDFCYDTMKEGRIAVDIADEIGYFTVKEAEIRKNSAQTVCPFDIRDGCQAGKSVLGIRANGDISPCLFIRNRKYIEGNAGETPLEEIWKKKDAFGITRGMTKEKLLGFCGICQYGKYCLGGCTGARLALKGSPYENRYCAFYYTIEKERIKAEKTRDMKTLVADSRSFIQTEAYQIAEVYLSRAYKLKPENLEVIDLLGFVHFFLENYTLCKKFNEKALAIDPDHAYAFKGLGLCFVRMGEVEKGIKLLYQAIELADPGFTDPYFDLSLVLLEINRIAEALHVLGVGRNLSPQFRQKTEDFYTTLKIKLNDDQVF